MPRELMGAAEARIEALEVEEGVQLMVQVSILGRQLLK